MVRPRFQSALTITPIVIAVPRPTQTLLGSRLTFRRVGGVYTAPNFLAGLQFGCIIGQESGIFSQTIPAGSVTQYPLIISQSQTFSTMVVSIIQPAGGGTVTTIAGSQNITINTMTSGFLTVGGSITILGNTYLIMTATAGGGTGSYVLYTNFPTTNSGIAYTSNVSYGWVQTAYG